MNAPADTGAEAALCWTRPAALVSLALALAACSTTPPAPPADKPPAQVVPTEAPTVAVAPPGPLQHEPPAPQAPEAPSHTPSGTGKEEPSDEPVGPRPEPESAEPPEGEPAAPEPAPPPPPQEPETVIDATRRGMRSTAEWLASGVDGWFGSEPFEGGRVTDGRISIAAAKRQAESIDYKVRLHARLRLPNLRRRSAYLFIGSDNEREAVADTPGALSRQDRLQAERPEDRSFFAGLGVALRDVLELRLGFRGVKPYAQARYRKPWNPSPYDLIEFRQTFFWKLSDRFGSTTALSYEHAFSRTTALRWITATTITQKSRVFDYSSIVGVYKSYGGQRLSSLEAIAVGREQTGTTVTEHGVQVKWLQPVYKDWLLGEIAVGQFWPRMDPALGRVRRWALGGVLTMRF
jgi:hypothetical protein